MGFRRQSAVSNSPGPADDSEVVCATDSAEEANVMSAMIISKSGAELSADNYSGEPGVYDVGVKGEYAGTAAYVGESGVEGSGVYDGVHVSDSAGS